MTAAAETHKTKGLLYDLIMVLLQIERRASGEVLEATRSLRTKLGLGEGSEGSLGGDLHGDFCFCPPSRELSNYTYFYKESVASP